MIVNVEHTRVRSLLIVRKKNNYCHSLITGSVVESSWRKACSTLKPAASAPSRKLGRWPPSRAQEGPRDLWKWW